MFAWAFSWRKEAHSEPSEPTLDAKTELLFESADRLVESQVTSETEWIWRPVWILTICGILLALLLTGLREYRDWLNQPLSTVVVDGATRHINKTRVAERVASDIDARLLELELNAIQDRLVQEPWINEAVVRRTWPPSLKVSLIEEVPVARWGNRGLLNHQGDIFWPDRTTAYQNLPVLVGPSHDTVRIMQQFRDLNALFLRSGIRLAGLELESRGAWTLTLDNGIRVVAGRDDLMPRLRRFIQVYEAQLASQLDLIRSVDIRYTNGVAVKWKVEEKKNKV